MVRSRIVDVKRQVLVFSTRTGVMLDNDRRIAGIKPANRRNARVTHERVLNLVSAFELTVLHVVFGAFLLLLLTTGYGDRSSKSFRAFYLLKIQKNLDT